MHAYSCATLSSLHGRRLAPSTEVELCPQNWSNRFIALIIMYPVNWFSGFGYQWPFSYNSKLFVIMFMQIIIMHACSIFRLQKLAICSRKSLAFKTRPRYTGITHALINKFPVSICMIGTHAQARYAVVCFVCMCADVCVCVCRGVCVCVCCVVLCVHACI